MLLHYSKHSILTLNICAVIKDFQNIQQITLTVLPDNFCFTPILFSLFYFFQHETHIFTYIHTKKSFKHL